MPNERLGSRIRNGESGNHEIRFVDDLSDENHSDGFVEMDIDNDDLLMDEDGVLEQDDAEDRLGDSSGVHSGEFDFDDDSDVNYEDGDVADRGDEVDEEAEDDDDDDEGAFDDQNIDGLFSNSSHPALQALGRLRRLVPPMNGREEWNEEDGDEANDDDDIDTGDARIRIPLLEALRGTLVNPRTTGILRALRSHSDPEILTGLSELSNFLLIPQGGFGISYVPVEPLSVALVNLLQTSDTIEVQVMTARAMSQLIDSGSNGATKALINAGVVPVMRRMFENVFYIDLIEQLIHVVKPVAVTEPRLVLESGCLMPCVGTLDFFNEYIQREIMAAIDACAKEVTTENSSNAKDLLAIFPEHPNDNVIGTYSALVISIAKLNESDFKDIATPTMWDNLVRFVQPGTPHISRVMRAVAHTAIRCPTFAQNYDLLADLVFHTLVQDSTQADGDLFSKLISVSKDVLFGGLKLLQVLLPLPDVIGNFVGPYRKEASGKFEMRKKEFISYAETAIPLAIASYSASMNTPVRQLSVLVVMQVVTLFKNEEEFTELARKLGIPQFTAQVISEGNNHLALSVGGLDIAWDLVSNYQMLLELSNSGISGDLEQYITGKADEPSGQFSPTDDLKPVASYMADQLLKKVQSVQESTSEDITRLIESVKEGEFKTKDLLEAPLPDLIRAGLLDALERGFVSSYLSDDMVTLLQSAVTRLEKFDLQLTGSRAKSIEDVLSRLVYIRLSEMGANSSPDRSWAVSVSAFATVRSLEDFVRNRLQVQQRIFPAARSRSSNSGGDNDRYRFWAGGNRLPRDVSVLKAIQDQHGIPVLKYQRIDEKEEEEDDHEDSEKNEASINEPLESALRLLRGLAQENEKRGEVVSWDKFRSVKLTAKLSRQLSDVLAIAASMLPQWTFDTVHEYPFLYPLKVRLHFVQLTSFGMGRNLKLLRRMQQESDDTDDDLLLDEDESNQILGRHKHQKFRLSRDSILEGAIRLLDISSKNPAVVEVMFYGEEGTGKGPTQEFFALASQSLSDISLGMWRHTSAGLYPESNPDPSPTVLRNFRGMGMLVARALLDKRILDFHLNPAFFDAVLSETGPSVDKLRRVDPSLAGSLDKLLDAKPTDLSQIGLDFTLPGTEIELLPSGKDIEVTAENVGDYVHSICDFVVGFGIQKQIDAFRGGFSDTIPVSALKSFMHDELATLCGADRGEDWSLATLRDAFTADHGYQISSEPVQRLISILSTFDRSERRKFLMFATGSPHLPVGGFRALTPPFTVVVKHPDNEDLDVDQYLPSVMTCANYFKLPSYSSEEIMRQQLKVAMSEGSDAFLLS